MWPERAAAAGKELAEELSGFPAQFVVAPAMGGIIIGHEVARALELPFVFAERQDGAFALRRGFRLSSGDSVVVIEDVFTTGKSTREVIALVAAAGAKAIAAGSIVDRGLPPGALGIPSRSLLTLEVPAWSEADCPLCGKGISLDTPGSRYKKN